MSLFNTLRVGASGMATSSMSLSVIGDNIANLNTTGYKGSRANFADAIPQNIATLGGTAQLGNGSVTGSMATNFQQGLLSGTGSALDMAISGSGFFQVKDGAQSYFTRDGSFLLDQDNFLVTPQGFRVQGYKSDNGSMTGAPGDLELDLNQISPQATSLVELRANLDADAAIDTTLTALQGTMDGTAGAPTLLEVTGTDNTYSTSVTSYDSLGVPHDVTVVWQRTSTSEWSWSAVVDAGEAEISGAAGTSGAALEIASGTATFDSNGVLTDFQSAPSALPWGFPGAATFTFDMGVGFQDADSGNLTMTGEQGSTTYSVSQNGYGQGDVTTIKVDGTGTLWGVYTNGQELALGQVVVAEFTAPHAMDRVGNNLYRGTYGSGEPAIGVAGAGGRGSIQNYSLERSNVELETEFVNMIQAQRSYQGSASVIRTADETLQTLVQLV